MIFSKCLYCRKLVVFVDVWIAEQKQYKIYLYRSIVYLHSIIWICYRMLYEDGALYILDVIEV